MGGGGDQREWPIPEGTPRRAGGKGCNALPIVECSCRGVGCRGSTGIVEVAIKNPGKNSLWGGSPPPPKRSAGPNLKENIT